MPFRAPKKLREWLLLFSPAMVIWAGNILGARFLKPPVVAGISVVETGAMQGGAYGMIAAAFLSLMVGCYFVSSKTDWLDRVFAGVPLGIGVALVNLAVAYAGCAMFGR